MLSDAAKIEALEDASRIILADNVSLQKEVRRLQGLLEKSPQNVVSPFTAEEFKRMRFILHPDRNSGKTHDLWVKVNQMAENKNG